VNTNPSKLKYGLNGLAMVALAGPASNMILAVLFAGLSVLAGTSAMAASEVAQRAALLSVYLGLFNLLPVPPLDGSKLLIAMRFPPALYMELARFGFVLLLLAMSLTNLGGYLSYYSQRITELFFSLFYWTR
jgi:Zn-dependent protease